MNIHKEVKSIIDTLQLCSDPARKEMSKTYFPTSMQVIGVANPDLKRIVRELRIMGREWPDDSWIALCRSLVATEIFECQMLAYDIIGSSRKLIAALSREELYDLGMNLDNWASVDSYSVLLYGVLWRMGRVDDREVHQKLRSPDHWERRVAVVSTVALNLKSRGGTGDTARTLEVCVRVVDDHHDMIQKALSWALRELSKRDRQAVEDFLETYGQRLARRVIREVRHKLEFGTKN